MDEKDLINERQKYLDEMMKLYSMNKKTADDVQTTIQEQETSENTTNTPSENMIPENVPENFQSDIIDEEVNAPNAEESNENSAEESFQQQDMQTVDKRFPPPVIPEFIRNPEPTPPPPQPMPIPQMPPPMNIPNIPPQPPQRPQMPPPPPTNTPNIPRPTPQRPQTPNIPPAQNQYGFLKVEVRTGDNGLPVPNAAVTISRQVNNSEELIFTGTTNMSGATEKIKLPAPNNMKNENPSSFGNYTPYTVTVFEKDFYRETSREVPVFAGITSIQRFNLIPQPFNYDDRGQSIVINNTEPEF